MKRLKNTYDKCKTAGSHMKKNIFLEVLRGYIGKHFLSPILFSIGSDKKKKSNCRPREWIIKN
jgi:hypothetical protein